AKPSSTMASDRINFIYKDDARGILLALLEKVADTAGAHPHKHSDEVRPENREERHVGLAGNRTRQQGLARSRRADQQHAFRNTPAKLLEFLRIFPKLDN